MADTVTGSPTVHEFRTFPKQIAEEIEDPIANDMYMTIDRNTDYQPPPRDD